MTVGRAAQTVLERIPYDPVAWGAIVDAHPEAEVFHGPAWLAYLAASHGATIEAPRVIAAAVALPPAVTGPPPPPPEAPKAEPVPWDLRRLRRDRSGGPQPWI